MAEREAPEHRAAEGEADNEKAPAKKTGEDEALGVRNSLQYRQLPEWDSNHQQAA